MEAVAYFANNPYRARLLRFMLVSRVLFLIASSASVARAQTRMTFKGLHVLFLFLCGLTLAHGQTSSYLDLHDFGGPGDGSQPYAKVTFDSVGNMYGTTTDVGAHFEGTVWQITASGTYEDLHDFGAGSDGQDSKAAVTLDASGNLYGTTVYGGANTTANGGLGGGTVWEITASGIYKDLHDFGAGTDGYEAFAGVSFDSSGNIFGTAFGGGTHVSAAGVSYGMVWEITVSGTYKDLHDFGAGHDGKGPVGGATFDPAGNMYGTTSTGGANTSALDGYGGGMIWEIAATGTYIDLHDFGAGTDGENCQAGVTSDAFGNLYGATAWGGPNTSAYNSLGEGMIWEITTSGTYKDLHDFGATGDGVQPEASVTLDASGNIYGTTFEGGANTSAFGGKGGGMVWEIPYLAQIGSLTLNPTSVVGGSDSTGTVTLTGPAPSGGVVVSLSSSSVHAKVPSSATVASGQTSATFTVTTTPTAAKVAASIKATEGSSSQKAVLTINAPVLSALSLNPGSVTGGASTTGTVTLSGPAPSAGIVLSLASSSPEATVPSSVTVSSGKASVTFTVSTIPTPAKVAATITAQEGSSSRKAVLTINAPVLSALSLNHSSVTGGASATGTVTLSGPAPSAGTVVTLYSSSADATVPSSVTVASGKTSATFTVATIPTSRNFAATITGHVGSSSQKAVLTVEAPVLSALSLSPSTVTGGTSTTGKVTLSGPAPSAGTVVSLYSSSSHATVPSSVMIASGKISATFTVATIPTSANVAATITGHVSSSSQKAVLTINASVLNTMWLTPSTVTGGKTSTGTVKLSGPAPSGGTIISLSSSSGDATVPATVTIAAGQTTATFTVTTSTVSDTTTVTITAGGGGVSKTATLTITP